mgnify:FL=1
MRLVIITLFLVVTLPEVAIGQDLVYTPKNPAFGGNTLNYQ